MDLNHSDGGVSLRMACVLDTAVTALLSAVDKMSARVYARPTRRF